MSESTAYEYLRRLNDFMKFVAREYVGLTVDNLIGKVKKAVYDPYSILSKYAIYLQNSHLHKHFEATCCECEKLLGIS